MLTLPHRPDPGSMVIMANGANDFIKESSKLQMDKFLEGDVTFFRVLGEQWFLTARFNYLNQKPIESVVRAVRSGLEKNQIAQELGQLFNAWKVWDYFLYSRAVSWRGMMEFYAILPEEYWAEVIGKPVPWLVTQTQAVCAIFNSKEEEASQLLDQLKEAVFDNPLPPELHRQLPEIHHHYQLLKALPTAAGLTSSRSTSVTGSA